MPEQPQPGRFLDVWIQETNTVYRQVPFSVVTDWVQQSRLLPEDRVRSPGAKDWIPVSKMPQVTPYVPKAEPFRADDQAEAMAPVELDVHVGTGHRRHEESDDDPDMIPLIDISLVLLVFFMMTATVAGAGAFLAVPEVTYLSLDYTPDMLWIAVRKDADDPTKYTYAVGKGENGPTAETTWGTLDQTLGELQSMTGDKLYDIRIMADKSLPYATVEDLTLGVERLRPRGADKSHGIRNIRAAVQEKTQQ
jgi:biopolymer transport protein ExbD